MGLYLSRTFFACGTSGSLYYYDPDAEAWLSMTSPTAEHLRAINGAPDGTDVFAVGWNGTIIHWNGFEWTEQASGSAALLTGVWRIAADDVWAVGHGGVVLHYDGSSWSSVAGTGANGVVNDVWAYDAEAVWITGDEGTWRGLGSPLSWSDAGGIGSRKCIYGFGPDSDVITGGFNGVKIWDGATWETMNGTYPDCYSIWGESISSVFAGSSTDFGHYNGTTWTRHVNGSGTDVAGVVGKTANTCMWVTKNAGRGWTLFSSVDGDVAAGGVGATPANTLSDVCLGTMGNAPGLRIPEQGPYTLIGDDRNYEVNDDGHLKRDKTIASRCRARLLIHRGKWAPDPEMGSRLWTIKTMKNARQLAMIYIEEALADLIEAGEIVAIEPLQFIEDQTTGRLGVDVEIRLPRSEAVPLGLVPLGE